MNMATAEIDMKTTDIPNVTPTLMEGILAGTAGAEQVARSGAWDAFLQLPAPTAFDEEWRRTYPEQFPFGQVQAASNLGELEEAGTSDWDTEFEVVVEVSDKGIGVRDRAGVLKDGLHVMPLSRAYVEQPEMVENLVKQEILADNTGKLEALNAACWNAGLFIQIPAGTVLEKGILIRYRFESAGSLILPRLMVSVGDSGYASIVEHFSSPDGVEMMNLATKTLSLGANARLKIYTLRDWGNQTYDLTSEMARAGRDSQVDLMGLNLGGKVGKLKFGSEVAGPNSAAELDGIFLVTGDQHMEQTTLQVHSSPDTYSRLLYKGVAKDKGRSIYRGIIQATPGAIRVDAYQTNNNVVLNRGAKVDTIPGLLIDADDLKCSHGATIGNIDEEQVFYLRCRGLSESEARRIVLVGFFDEVTQRIPYPFLRERTQEIIMERLDNLA